VRLPSASFFLFRPRDSSTMKALKAAWRILKATALPEVLSCLVQGVSGVLAFCIGALIVNALLGGARMVQSGEQAADKALARLSGRKLFARMCVSIGLTCLRAPRT
jgi:hypothetical protein